MHLLVGLGNPGKEYEETRHNIGFMALDAIIRWYRFSGPKTKSQGELYEGSIDGEKILAVKPLTYMNRSGVCVGEISRFYKVDINKTIVFHDELDLVFGKMRVKAGGGNGGHNGLKSLDAHIGSEYQRVRLGIGHPGDKDRVASYVLERFSKAEMAQVEPWMEAVAAHIGMVIHGDAPGFLNKIVISRT